MCYDSLDYYFSFLIWIFTVSLSLFFNLLYSYFFFNNFSDNKNLKKIFSQPFFSNFNIIANPTSKFFLKSKHESNYILFSLIRRSELKIQNDRFIENLFSRSISKKNWLPAHNFFTSLYASSYLTSTYSSDNNTFFYNSDLNKITNFKNNNKNFSLFFYFYNNCNNLIFHKFVLLTSITSGHDRQYQTLLTKNRYNFTFSKWSGSSSVYSFTTKNKIGNFFFNELSAGHFSFLITKNPTMFSFLKNLENTFNAAKWNRWLYRYSLLHRKNLKNSHKITITKRLLNSGFYNSSLFDKNIWASENFMRFEKTREPLGSLFNLYYSYFFHSSSEWQIKNIVNNKNEQSLQFLKFYENSFFWFLKRFYLFNTFESNTVKSKKVIQNKNFFFDNLSQPDANDDLILYFLNLSNLTKNSSQIFDSFINFKSIDKEKTKHFAHYLNFYSKFLKDSHISSDESSMLNEDNMKILYWIVSPLFFNHKILYFDYNKFLPSETNFAEKFIVDLNYKKHDLSFVKYTISEQNTVANKTFFKFFFNKKNI